MGPLSKARLPGKHPSRETRDRGFRMRYCHLLAVAMTIACSSALAQTPLSAYVDSNGFIDVQKLTCAQLAGTYQEDADVLVQRLVQRPGQEALHGSQEGKGSGA